MAVDAAQAMRPAAAYEAAQARCASLPHRSAAAALQPRCAALQGPQRTPLDTPRDPRGAGAWARPRARCLAARSCAYRYRRSAPRSCATPRCDRRSSAPGLALAASRRGCCHRIAWSSAARVRASCGDRRHDRERARRRWQHSRACRTPTAPTPQPSLAAPAVMRRPAVRAQRRGRPSNLSASRPAP